MRDTSSKKYVSNELFESTNKTIFERLSEHNKHLDQIEVGMSSLKNDMMSGFQSIYNAIGDNRANDLRGKNSLYVAFFGVFATLFGLVVYFGDLKTQKTEAEIEHTEKILEEKIKSAIITSEKNDLELLLKIHESK